MTSAEIIAIGTELLLGEIQDTNTRELAIFLKNNGIDLYRTTIVGDNQKRITAAIRDACSRADIVITCGGLGPTVDDATREAVSNAVDRDIEFSEELWQQIQDRFRRFDREASENNKKQAYIPSGAIPIENRVGTAPAFIVETSKNTIISLPGVPRELEHLLKVKIQPYLKSRFGLNDVIRSKTLRVAGIGESQVDQMIADLEEYHNPTVGLSAHPGLIDIRITAKASNLHDVEKMLEKMVSELYTRLGELIFGEDNEKLEDVALRKLKEKNWKAEFHHCGFGTVFESKLLAAGILPNQLRKIDDLSQVANMMDYDLIVENSKENQSDVHFISTLREEGEKQNLYMRLITPFDQFVQQMAYGGPPELSKDWAANQAFNFIRLQL